MVPPDAWPNPASWESWARPKSVDLHLALAVYEHVVGLDVQVQNLIIMSNLERMGYSFEHAGRQHQGKRAALFAHELGQRYAVDILHDEVGHGAFYLEIVHADDVRIGQHGRRTRFIKTWNVTWRRRRCGLSKRHQDEDT